MAPSRPVIAVLSCVSKWLIFIFSSEMAVSEETSLGQYKFHETALVLAPPTPAAVFSTTTRAIQSIALSGLAEISRLAEPPLAGSFRTPPSSESRDNHAKQQNVRRSGRSSDQGSWADSNHFP